MSLFLNGDGLKGRTQYTGQVRKTEKNGRAKGLRSNQVMAWHCSSGLASTLHGSKTEVDLHVSG